MPYNVANIAGAVSQAEQDNQRANLSALQIQRGQQDLQTAQFGQSQQEGLRAAMAAGHRPDGSFDTKAAMDVLSKSAPELIPKLQEQMGGQDERIRQESIGKMITIGILADKVVKSNGVGYDQFLIATRKIAPDVQLPPTYDAQAMQVVAQQAASLGGKTTLKEGDTQLDVLGNVSTLAPPGIKAQTLAETKRLNDAKIANLGIQGGSTKVPAGYRMLADGSMEAIPGGPADQKAQMKASGGQTVNDVVASIRDTYNQLDAKGGIANVKKGPADNISAGLSTSAPGQFMGRMLGTSNQSLRNTILQQRPLLLQAIMKATGMSAKQMDSNAELKLYLATATDPTLDLQTNKRALDMIEKLYGSDKPTTAQPLTPPTSPTSPIRPPLSSFGGQ
jgi:hypothetical protein